MLYQRPYDDGQLATANDSAIEVGVVVSCVCNWRCAHWNGVDREGVSDLWTIAFV